MTHCHSRPFKSTGESECDFGFEFIVPHSEMVAFSDEIDFIDVEFIFLSSQDFD